MSNQKQAHDKTKPSNDISSSDDEIVTNFCEWDNMTFGLYISKNGKNKRKFYKCVQCEKSGTYLRNCDTVHACVKCNRFMCNGCYYKGTWMLLQESSSGYGCYS